MNAASFMKDYFFPLKFHIQIPIIDRINIFAFINFLRSKKKNFIFTLYNIYVSDCLIQFYFFTNFYSSFKFNLPPLILLSQLVKLELFSEIISFEI